MQAHLEKRLLSELDERSRCGLLRSLPKENDLIDFCSNDYLGFVRLGLISTDGLRQSGSTGSRLISGNRKDTEDLEAELARVHGAEAALVFNSGYDANLSLLSALARRGDTILMDELSHASMHDGARLSFAKAHKFRHNNLGDLECKIKRSKGLVFVVVESVYSMDGDSPPLAELAELCANTGAALIVDEAHATGVCGAKGLGMVQELGIEELVAARVHTFGKALGCHGAVVLGSKILYQYLINFGRSLIYTTALSPRSIGAIGEAYRLLAVHEDLRGKLKGCIKFWVEAVSRTALSGRRIPSASAIQSILVPEPNRAAKVSLMLAKAGFDARAILSPTVPKGKERIRICLHAFNTHHEIENFLAHFERALLEESNA